MAVLIPEQEIQPEQKGKRSPDMTIGKCVLIVTMIALVGFALDACNQASGTGNAAANNSASQPGLASVATPNSTGSMSNMNMPAPTKTNESPKNTQGAAPNQIVIENFAFAPATLTVKAGTTVTWINRDDEPHTVNDNDKRFKSGTLDTDGKFSFTLTAPGTYNYFCSIHPRMTGQIIVK